MPQPSATQVHVDAPLTNISVAYMQDEADYIAGRVFPVIPVQKRSDRYFVYNKGDFFRDEAELRGPGTESAGGGYNIDNTPTYFCDVYAYHKDVDGQIRANSDNPLDADRDAAIFVTQKLLLKREINFLAKYFTTGVWTGSSTGTDITPGVKWSAGSTATPIEDVQTEAIAIKQNTGKWPNRLVLGVLTYKGLVNNPEIVDRYKYTRAGIITPELLAGVFAPPELTGGDFQVLVAAAIKNAAHEGATNDMEFLASSKDALLTYANPNPGIMQVSAGYIFSWTGLLGAGAFGNAIYRIPMPWLGVSGGTTERVEGELAFDPKVVGADLGSYFLAAVA